jgi:biotin carboxyl carrier protein
MKKEEKFGFLNINSSIYKTKLSRKFIDRKPFKSADPKLILSFIPGTVLDIPVKAGQKVKPDDDLMILDAMKMQNKLKCVVEGTIKRIAVKKGDKVSKGTLLLELE